MRDGPRMWLSSDLPWDRRAPIRTSFLAGARQHDAGEQRRGWRAPRLAGAGGCRRPQWRHLREVGPPISLPDHVSLASPDVSGEASPGPDPGQNGPEAHDCRPRFLVGSLYAHGLLALGSAARIGCRWPAKRVRPQEKGEVVPELRTLDILSRREAKLVGGNMWGAGAQSNDNARRLRKWLIASSKLGPRSCSLAGGCLGFGPCSAASLLATWGLWQLSTHVLGLHRRGRHWCGTSSWMNDLFLRLPASESATPLDHGGFRIGPRHLDCVACTIAAVGTPGFRWQELRRPISRGRGLRRPSARRASAEKKSVRRRRLAFGVPRPVARSPSTTPRESIRPSSSRIARQRRGTPRKEMFAPRPSDQVRKPSSIAALPPDDGRAAPWRKSVLQSRLRAPERAEPSSRRASAHGECGDQQTRPGGERAHRMKHRGAHSTTPPPRHSPIGAPVAATPDDVAQGRRPIAFPRGRRPTASHSGNHQDTPASPTRGRSGSRGGLLEDRELRASHPPVRRLARAFGPRASTWPRFASRSAGTFLRAASLRPFFDAPPGPSPKEDALDAHPYYPCPAMSAVEPRRPSSWVETTRNLNLGWLQRSRV